MRTPYVPHTFGEAVAQKLRSRQGWVSAAVASSIPWPEKDVWIVYGGDDFILRGTHQGEKPAAPSIVVPGARTEVEACMSRLYRFTSVLGWFLGGYVDVVDVMSGSHPIGYGAQYRQAFSEVGQAGAKSFSCNYMPIIEEEPTRIALAFWREGEKLRRVHDSYSFLSYFKVIESQFADGRSREDWFNRNLDHLTDRASTRVAELRAAGENVGEHLYHSGRNAVAHATLGRGIVDPDVPADRRRIKADLEVMRELARRFISQDLGVPTASELYRTRNRLEPWEPLVDAGALAELKAGGTPAPELLGLDMLRVALALWPDAPMPGLAELTMHVDVVHEGVVRVVLLNDRGTMVFVFVLNFRSGQVDTQLDNSGLAQNEQHKPIEEDVREFYTVFHSVIANALVELRMAGREPVQCEIVHPVNIIPRVPSDAVEEAVVAFRRQMAEGAG